MFTLSSARWGLEFQITDVLFYQTPLSLFGGTLRIKLHRLISVEDVRNSHSHIIHIDFFPFSLKYLLHVRLKTTTYTVALCRNGAIVLKSTLIISQTDLYLVKLSTKNVSFQNVSY